MLFIEYVTLRHIINHPNHPIAANSMYKTGLESCVNKGYVVKLENGSCNVTSEGRTELNQFISSHVKRTRLEIR